MTDDEFNVLAAKTLAGEASADEQKQFDALLAQDAGREREFLELKSAWSALKHYSPLTQALEAPPTQLPQHRLSGLQAVVRRQFSHRTSAEGNLAGGLIGQWLKSRKLACASIVGCILLVTLFAGARLWFSMQNANGETVGYLLAKQGKMDVLRAGQNIRLDTIATLLRGDEMVLAEASSGQVLTRAGLVQVAGPARGSAAKLIKRAEASSLNRVLPGSGNPRQGTLPSALFRPIRQLLAMPLLAVTRDVQGISLYSPREVTASLEPLILWKAESGKKYDVTIVDELDSHVQPWELRGATSPVDFAKVAAWENRPLTNESLYRITVRENGNPLSACQHTFRTATNSVAIYGQTTDAKVLRAFSLSAGDRPCPGDALAQLMTLPPRAGDAELVLRLELVLFGRLGLRDEYQATASKLESSSYR